MLLKVLHGSGDGLMYSDEAIKRMSKELVLSYVYHVRDRVKEGNLEYINSGLDEDVNVYAKIFKTVLRRVLIGSKRGLRGVSPVVLEECSAELEKTIKVMGYTKAVGNMFTSQCIYDVCAVVLGKVKDEVYSSMGNKNIM